MKTIRAIYEDGVFKPFDAVEMPEGTFVQLQAMPVMPIESSNSPDNKLSAIYGILMEQERLAEQKPDVRRLDYPT